MIATFVLLAGLALGQTAEKPATDETLAAKVKQLVGKQGLGHDELAKREAAEKSLVELGPDVLPLLPAVSDCVAVTEYVPLAASGLENV